MYDRYDPTMRIILSLLTFPVFFQGPALEWVWGAGDDSAFMMLKRIFLLLPVAAVIASCWISIACLLTVIVRAERRTFVSVLFVTWWDLARAILGFWGGFFKFVFLMAGWVVSFVRISLLGIWLSIQDMILTPIRAARGVGQMATQAGTPWIAVILTLFWCGLEAFVFTFVMSSLVIDTLSSITGLALNTSVVYVVLYLMLLAFVIGSFAIVATLESAIRSRNIKQIALIVLVESVAMVFEVLFLYREFVDAIMPAFAQYAGEDFRPGLIPVLMIASIVWAGTRGMTWFLFAAAGTPTIMAIIQRTGLRSEGSRDRHSSRENQQFAFVKEAIDRIRKDIDWYHDKGDEILTSFLVPPLQIVAATINFLTLLISAKHIFRIPFKSYKDMLHADDLIEKLRGK